MARALRRLDRLPGAQRRASSEPGSRSRSRRALLVYPGYALMFHELSSEPDLRRGLRRVGTARHSRRLASVRAGRFALAGLGVAAARPRSARERRAARFALFPLLLGGRPGASGSTGRLRSSLAATLPLVAWSVHNGVRFDTYGLARGGNAIVPFYRAFITDNIVSPENGEQSRRLARRMRAASAHPRALSLVRRHARRALRARELPGPRGPLSPLRPGLRLGHGLPRAP